MSRYSMGEPSMEDVTTLARQCYLVSKPLEPKGPAKQLPNWTVIGNGKAIPDLLEKMPILEHWAVCVLPADTPPAFDPSEPSARIFFIRAAYFELGAASQAQSDSGIFMSESYCVLNHPTIWPEASVRTITSIREIGCTSRSEVWFSGRNRELLKEWGVYRPLLWNCQEFAILMAQMAVDSARKKRDFGFAAGYAWLSAVPMVGRGLSFGCLLGLRGYRMTDAMKDWNIHKKLKDLVEKYPELQRLLDDLAADLSPWAMSLGMLDVDGIAQWQRLIVLFWMSGFG
ncbi:hypothetical protein C8A03DRAFT_33275 [Achaetomium macrosporum]|uniref:Uncharacterized protein n=1 Tax=Achaetomium macrosporum TaxID=79813 RepID=A0AAN7CBE9_9PEZI|nr:hypothetical protein C8A03DRAFT_33275 [Achaetomium macrosporum]